MLPGEAKGIKILDLKKVENFFQENHNSLNPKGRPAEGFQRDMHKWQ